jgi:hypothetical protein
MAPVVHRLEADYYGKINFVYLDADDPATIEFQRQLGFAYQPEFYLLDGQGGVIQKWIGRVEREEFVKVFDTVSE